MFSPLVLNGVGEEVNNTDVVTINNGECGKQGSEVP
jgi:hypothetical protein